MSEATLLEQVRSYGTFEYKHGSLDRAALLKKVDDRLTALESALRELWALRMMRMSCSVRTAAQNLEYSKRSDAAGQEVERLMGGK